MFEEFVMRRILLPVLTLAFASLFVSEVVAQAPVHNPGCHERFHLDFYRNKRWPQPFRQMDTIAVMNFFEVQRNNGWTLHNTLGAAMYDPATHTLTDSGVAHVRWIVSRAPQNRRVLFVLQGDTQEQTAKRVESAQIAVSRFVPTGPLPKIYITDIDAPGSSGAYQTAIVRAMTDSVPAPRLPSGSGGAGAGGTGLATP